MNLKNSILDKVATMKDGSLKITIITNELSPQQMADLFLSVNKEILQLDLPEDMSERKSQSERLRSVLFRLWEQTGKDKYTTAVLHYNSKMEEIINHFKDKLN